MNRPCLRAITGPGSGYTERSELYRPDDSRTNTIDLKDRKRKQRGGSVPFAEVDDLGREYDDVSS